MVRYQIALDQEEADKLLLWANEEYRDPREQIRFILRQELNKRGLLSIERQRESEELNQEDES